MDRIMGVGLAVLLVACGEEAATGEIAQPLTGAVAVRNGAFVDVPTPWADLPHQTIELAKPRWSYAPEGVTASCESGWIERSIDLAIEPKSVRATFVEYEVGCGAGTTPRSITAAVFVLE